MDSADSTVREHISQYADFLGAVRLPENAFRQNALTDVTADVVFFQKNSGEKLYSRDWVNTASIEVDDLKNGGNSRTLGCASGRPLRAAGGKPVQHRGQDAQRGIHS